MDELWEQLARADAWCLLSSAIIVVVFSAHRALLFEEYIQKNVDLQEDNSLGLTLRPGTALMLPIFSSISLLLFFYFFKTLAFLSSLVTCFSSTFAISFCTVPILEGYFPSTKKDITFPHIGEVSKSYLFMIPISIVLNVLWVISGHWILNNVLGMSLAVLFISMVRVPNLKTASLVLLCLFFYDIFWVFYSARIFGSNVMVSVATQKAENPVNVIAQQLNLPVVEAVSSQLDLPMKLIWGGIMLGIGDMVVPGMVVAYAKKFDEYKGNGACSGYFMTSVIGYTVGLVVSLLCSIIYQVAQPALLYLVPCCLLPILVMSFYRGEIHELWNGFSLRKDLSE